VIQQVCGVGNNLTIGYNTLRNTQHAKGTKMLSIDQETFEKLVVRALAGLPAWVQAMLDNVEVTVAETPSLAQRRRMGLRPGETLLGLYEGVPQTRRTRSYGLVLPDKITLFRRPILAACRTSGEVEARVRSVVLHELAHHFGIDDERLRELGAY
jgi:predicted Zn-dependent protease with MMP-like domain